MVYPGICLQNQTDTRVTSLDIQNSRSSRNGFIHVYTFWVTGLTSMRKC